MRAIVYRPTADGWKLEVCERAIPKPGRDEALIKVDFCGVCGSDVRRHVAFSAERSTVSGEALPIPGHEFSGSVVELGAASEFWKPEMRVVVNPLIGCGNCDNCLSGSVNRCQKNVEVIGYHRNGGFAEYCSVPLENLVVTAESVDQKRLALTEPLAVAINAASAIMPFEDNSVVVIGDGTIGVLTAWVAKKMFGKNVLLVGRKAVRMQVASELGIDVLAEGEIKDADLPVQPVVVVASGSQTGLELALNLTAKFGQLVFLGYLTPSDVGFSAESLNSIVRAEKTVTGSFGYSRETFETAVNVLMENDLDAAKIVDRTIGLDDLSSTLEKLISREIPKQKVVADLSLG